MNERSGTVAIGRIIAMMNVVRIVLEANMADPTRAVAEKLYQELDECLYMLRESDASDQVQQRIGVGLIMATFAKVCTIQQAHADGRAARLADAERRAEMYAENCTNKIQEVLTLTREHARLKEALDLFVKTYRVMYNVDQVYQTSYEQQEQLEQELRAAYEHARGYVTNPTRAAAEADIVQVWTAVDIAEKWSHGLWTPQTFVSHADYSQAHAEGRAAGLREAAKYLNDGEILQEPDELDPACKCKCFGVLGRVATYFEQQASEGGEHGH